MLLKIFTEKMQVVGLIALLILAGLVVWRYPMLQTASIISPMGGETFLVDQTVEIRWTPGNPGIRMIELVPQSGSVITIYQTAVFAYPVPDTSGSFSFVPSARGVPPGQYHIRVYNANSSDYSVTINPIRIALPQSPMVPVVVQSPNGGEIYTLGGPIKISWSGGKNKVWVGIAKAEYFVGGTYPLMAFITKDAVPNSFLVWDGKLCVLPTDCRPVTYWQPDGSIKVVVVSENVDGDYCTQSPDRPCNLDASNAAFTVKAAVVVTPTPVSSGQVKPSPTVIPLKPVITPPPALKSKPPPAPTSSPVPSPVSSPVPSTVRDIPSLSDEQRTPIEVKPIERRSFFGRFWEEVKGMISSLFGF